MNGVSQKEPAALHIQCWLRQDRQLWTLPASRQARIELNFRPVVSFKEHIDRVMRVILEVEAEFGNDPEFSVWVMEDPAMMRLGKFNEYGMVIKTWVQTQPDKLFQTRRELLRRFKKQLDDEGIEITVHQRILLQPTSA